MSSWAEGFRQRLQLLTDLLPAVARETRFALKSGTAINLFEHDLPRLSVDVDLTWLPVGDFAGDSRAIDEALRAMASALAEPPLRLQVVTSAPEQAQTVTRLIASRGRTRVQIETTPVMRGTVHPVRTMAAQPRVQEQFGFAAMQVLDFNDLYGGKLAAALSRQNPRDLFDVGILLDEGRFDVPLWRTFLVYLTAGPKPAWELLEPGEPHGLAEAFRTLFEGMTAEPTSVEALLANRAGMLARIASLLDDASREFLISVEREAPDFTLIGLPQAATLPGVRRKLQNLAQRSAGKREADYRQLLQTLERIRR
jgi:hypothetical protein